MEIILLILVVSIFSTISALLIVLWLNSEFYNAPLALAFLTILSASLFGGFIGAFLFIDFKLITPIISCIENVYGN